MLQIVLRLFLDRPYNRDLLRNYFWAIWYPTIYWFIAAATAVAAIPRILLRDKERRVTWTTPGRGIRPDSR